MELSLVLRRFLFTFLRWPFAVSIDGGRCFEINEGVSPGKVAKKPFLTAAFQVLGLGLQQARCRYFARSGFVLRLYTFAA